MTESALLQGRRIEPGEFLQLRELVASHPEWSRYQLSRELCVLWNWRTATGQWKDMAARTLMRKLAERGWIALPARRRLSPNRHRLAPPPARSWSTTPLTAPLSEIGPLRITDVSQQADDRAEVRAALVQFHYLGYRTPVGENLQYVVRDGTARLLAVLVFGAAAWKCAARDQRIGWTPAQRQARLSGIANNHRFLILPGVEVRHLASHLLERVARRIAADWQAKYGHAVVLLETFVERERLWPRWPPTSRSKPRKNPRSAMRFWRTRRGRNPTPPRTLPRASAGGGAKAPSIWLWCSCRSSSTP